MSVLDTLSERLDTLLQPLPSELPQLPPEGRRFSADIVLASIAPPDQFMTPYHYRLLLQFYDRDAPEWVNRWKLDRMALRYQLQLRAAQKRARELLDAQAAAVTDAVISESASPSPTSVHEGPTVAVVANDDSPPPMEGATEQVGEASALQEATVTDVIITVERYLLRHPETREICAVQGLDEGRIRFAVARELFGDDILIRLGMFPQWAREMRERIVERDDKRDASKESDEPCAPVASEPAPVSGETITRPALTLVSSSSRPSKSTSKPSSVAGRPKRSQRSRAHSSPTILPLRSHAPSRSRPPTSASPMKRRRAR